MKLDEDGNMIASETLTDEYSRETEKRLGYFVGVDRPEDDGTSSDSVIDSTRNDASLQTIWVFLCS